MGLFDKLLRRIGIRGARKSSGAAPEASTPSLQETIGNRGTEAALRGPWSARPAFPAPEQKLSMAGHRLPEESGTGPQQWEKTTSGWKDVGAAPESSPAPIKLPEKFKDEDKKFGWRAHYGAEDNESEETQRMRREKAESTHKVTRYFSDQERQDATLTPTPDPQRGNVLKTSEGELSANRKMLYVMSPDGRLLKHDGPETTQTHQGNTIAFHHSSPLAGGDVAHAGHIGTSGGKVTYLDDDSGHYRPDAAHTWDAFQRLKRQGLADTESTKAGISLVDKGGLKGVSDTGESLKLPFFAYDQTGGNETQARRKEALLEMIRRPRTSEGEKKPVRWIPPTTEGQGTKDVDGPVESEKGLHQPTAPVAQTSTPAPKATEPPQSAEEPKTASNYGVSEIDSPEQTPTNGEESNYTITKLVEELGK